MSRSADTVLHHSTGPRSSCRRGAAENSVCDNKDKVEVKKEVSLQLSCWSLAKTRSICAVWTSSQANCVIRASRDPRGPEELLTGWPLQGVNAGDRSDFCSEWLTVMRHLIKETEKVTHLLLISELKPKWTKALNRRNHTASEVKRQVAGEMTVQQVCH